METGSPGKRPVLPKRARLLVTAGMGMLALLLFGPRLVDIYVDWLWFGEVGFRSVWITVLLTRLAIVAAVALVVAGIVLAALLLAYRSRPFFVPDEPQRDPVAPLRSAVMRRPRLFGWGIAVTLGVVCGLIASFDWVKVQLFVHGGTFGIVDPEFGVYTHGNGFVAAPANRVNAAARDAENISDSNSGYPIYAVSDIASLGSGRQVIPVEQPRVYYGEVIAQADPDYAIVGGAPGSAPREYDTDTSKYTYTGAGGVSIGNWFNRTVFATKFAQHKFLFSREIGSESKVLIHRDPKERVQRVAPWLTTDDNPYPVVVNGRIVWIVDAYTTLDTYPYAQRSSLEGPVTSPTGIVRQGKQVSYVRNSVKATVDAYDGTVTLFQFDRDDPVLRTWMRAFPGTVKSEDQIPDELRAHFRYPEDLFEVQRSLLAKYHVDEPREFFTTNAFWSVPSDPTNDANATQPPFYVLVGDQQSAQPSFRLASAMVGYNREFLSAYISAHSDPANYGKLTVLELPTDTLTQGPQQIQNSMISDTRVASERTLLERSNRIHYGNLLSLPIADGGVLYVEPLYTERISTSPSSSTFPQLSRVLVSVREPRTEGGVRVGYAPTLAESLDQVFGPGTGRVATAPGGDAASAPPPGAGGPAPPQAVPPPRTTQPPAAPPRGPDVPPATVAELRETLADLRAVLDRLEKAIDAAETPGG
ncbi:UPF0182 family protein [Mycobacterium tuberculosis]|uniref:UPF0182 family protein n=1 Tax=Mycobacterium tuberculosis TaxID=1773 RepID=UPI0012DC3315|nr:UPF0182 family protein [Mycobacterium tuberculosis]